MKTKLLNSFILFLFLFFINGLTAQYFTENNIYYQITSSTAPLKVKVMNPNGTSGGGYTGDITIPSTVSNGGNTYIVTEIGYRAFYACAGLTSVTIPNSVTFFNSEAFSNCTGLTSVSIPNSVTSIWDWAFYKCSGLTTITIPDSVTFIGDYAFSASGLSSISIPNSFTSIGRGIFRYCTGLTSVSIPNSVTSIGNEAFNGCTELTSISIPDSVTSIGNLAFYNCNKLTSFTSLATTPPSLGSNVFYGTWQKNCALFVPENSKTAYAAASQWNGFKNVNTYLSTTETKNNLLKVYPNPAKDYVVISNISKGENISVYDLSGKILFQTKSIGNSVNINTSAYKNGIYLVKVGENTTKIMVSK
ncbi:leucine-rich repeat domain-containing protein [Cloacibacterium sp. TD35]|uniref:leucine-rich repeat domain-containing protein n=1 Tax=Cloacibacterium sp. TD35 TaxID=2976818 RepID=UPI00237E9AA7|nr:leucine-rich repeat protein [Cloacibacterium sp. TD35]WDT68505.1 leucine-rich repeat protein [Cloacibacterium sp. TD35]